ncbi:unnamed protein product [Rhodiola kirilowii]
MQNKANSTSTAAQTFPKLFTQSSVFVSAAINRFILSSQHQTKLNFIAALPSMDQDQVFDAGRARVGGVFVMMLVA